MPGSQMCDHISAAKEIAVSAGNSVAEYATGWSTVTLWVYMREKLSRTVKTQIRAAHPELRYWSMDRMPHCPAEEAFSWDVVCLSFPR